MKHAYLLLTHKNPTQLVQLISALQAENSYLFIHVDGKSTKVYNALQCLIELPRNVFICEERKNVSWGGFSQVEATMQLINMLVNTNINPDYVHLISGQDFPLKSASEIDNFFAQNNGKNFLNYFTLPCEHWARNGGLDRLLYTWNIDGGNGEKSEPTEPFPENIQPYGGSQWWSLTMDCINYLFETCREGHTLYDFYRHTLIPDEMIFQTIIMNSGFSTTVVNDNLRYIDWVTGPEYPRIFAFDNFDELICSNKIFARKFDIHKDSAIIGKIEAYIFNKQIKLLL